MGWVYVMKYEFGTAVVGDPLMSLANHGVSEAVLHHLEPIGVLKRSIKAKVHANILLTSPLLTIQAMGPRNQGRTALRHGAIRTNYHVEHFRRMEDGLRWF